VNKKKKRTRATTDRSAKQKALANRAYLASLEKQGMVRVALTPDEVNSDLAVILHGLDSARAHGPTRPVVERTTEATARSADKIHSSRGILHYHDITYEKGDRVSIYAYGRPNGAKLAFRYSGVMLSVNSKEIHIRTDDRKLSSLFEYLRFRKLCHPIYAACNYSKFLTCAYDDIPPA